MNKKISELPDISSGLGIGSGGIVSRDDFIVVVDSQTLTTGKSTIKAAVESAAPIFIKIKTSSSRNNTLIENHPPIDQDLKFEASEVGEGVFEVEFSGFFTGSSPIAYIDSNIVNYGLQKTYKFIFEPRPEDRENIGDLNNATIDGYVITNSEIKSLIFPNLNSDSDSDFDYEPMFFYENEQAFPHIGYFIEVKLMVSISEENPLYLRWCSSMPEQTNMLSGELQLTRLNQLN